MLSFKRFLLLLLLGCIIVTSIIAACDTAISQAHEIRRTWGSELKLTPENRKGVRAFGRSVAISGPMALVGDPSYHNDKGQVGAAYLLSAMGGSQRCKLSPSDPVREGLFGQSVAISSNFALVGRLGRHNEGVAYLFDATTGKRLAKLIASDAERGDSFGRSVAIDGNRALVGAAGAAYLFDATTGKQLRKLTASDAVERGCFGRSVAISGKVAIVGACKNGDGGPYLGAAYLFDVTTGKQIAQLTPTDAAARDNFGAAVAISGNRALVGAAEKNGEVGAAYLFDATTGKQLHKLTASDTSKSYFGFSVGISGNRAIVGAWADKAVGGSAYLFDVSTGKQLARINASDAKRHSCFGWSVAISDFRIIVGLLHGPAYRYNIPEAMMKTPENSTAKPPNAQ